MRYSYLESTQEQFKKYKTTAEKAIEQITDEQLFWVPNEECNSVAVLMRHLSGNMLSRSTNFLTTDGEKPSRDRDDEFENHILSRKELLDIWNKGWHCLLDTLASLTPNDLDKIIYIKKEERTAVDAINRQIIHYGYHIGQIVYICKMLVGSKWVNLSIPKKVKK